MGYIFNKILLISSALYPFLFWLGTTFTTDTSGHKVHPYYGPMFSHSFLHFMPLWLLKKLLFKHLFITDTCSQTQM